MKLFIVLCFITLEICASPGSSRNGKHKSKNVISASQPFFPVSSLSGMIREMTTDIGIENIGKAASEYNGTTWMERCCGMKIQDYSKVFKRFNGSPVNPQDEGFFSFLNPIIQRVNSVIDDFDAVYPDHFFMRLAFDDIGALEKIGDELKRRCDNNPEMSDIAKEFIQRVCIDIHTTICKLKGADGPHEPVVVHQQGYDDQ
ncbi:uncharacterized protein LOC116337562 [Contarinia nasturtii]|uniref:uncharacterized protein LOC116337562 n=1 Tax=Contarinia nasturtii TaxID=265458 RepID=UPI0012D3864D|nr:uncharacterized protein LOC116337562 [Contarinia nasturtii]